MRCEPGHRNSAIKLSKLVLMFKKIFSYVAPKVLVRRIARVALISSIWFAVQFSVVPVTSSSVQQSLITPSNATAQNTPEALKLELGKSVERELAGGQKHSYAIPLVSGDYFKVVFKQHGISIGATLELPDGTVLPLFDPILKKGDSSIERVVDASGTYKLNVFPTTKAPLGRYEIRLAELRPANENDRALEQARVLYLDFFRANREGRYLEARIPLMRALEIRERVLGPEDAAVADTLQRMAGSLMNTGDYAAAEGYRLRALKIFERVLGSDNPDFANELNQLGSLYRQKGDYLKAINTYLRALRIFERAHALEGFVVASMLGDLGSVYYLQGDYRSAATYAERSRATWEKLMGPDHFHLEPSFGFLGRVAYDAGDYVKAEKMFERALELREKALGPDDLGLPARLGDLAMLFATIGDYAKAEALYQRALSIYQRTGTTDPKINDTLFGLGRLYAAQGRKAEAIRIQTEASESEERYVRLNLALGSEREKLAFLRNVSFRSSRSISLHISLAPDDPAARNLAVTTVLRRKGRVQDALADNLAALRRRFAAGDQMLVDELNLTTSRLAKLYLIGPQRITMAEHQKQVKTLEDQRTKLEADIAARSLGAYESLQPVTLAAVRAALPNEAALIEFVVYEPFDPKAPDNRKAYGPPRYAAYVVRREGEVQWLEIGPAKEIDRLINTLRQALRDPARHDVRQIARAFDEKVMRPLRAFCGNATQLLIAPDGELNLIPFEALTDEAGNYLISNYSITYLTSGRELLRLGVSRQSKGMPLVLANPAFGEPAAPQVSLTKGRQTTAVRRRRSVTTGRDLVDVYFAPLLGTELEARTIQSLFHDATILTGASASESALKAATAPKLLHIATHGFFLQEGQTSDAAHTQLPSRARESERSENPLLRSGLALAGANVRSTGNDDGILTALEASGLNLWTTKLVTLSACDTGLGEVKSGEGVYGLRRAFVLAGAESLVMSLWPVSDYITREIMTRYYKNLKIGMGRGSALRQVQLEMLKRKDRQHPFFWASFIQSGDWANLDGQR